MNNPKKWLEVGLIYHLKLNKRKGIWGFGEEEAVMGR